MIYLTKEDRKRIHEIKYNLLMHDIYLFQEACFLTNIKYNI